MFDKQTNKQSWTNKKMDNQDKPRQTEIKSNSGGEI